MENQLPDTPASYVALGPSTQVQVDQFSDDLIQSVKEGEAHPLKVLVGLKALEKASERVIKEIAPNIMNEALKYQESRFDFYGVTIEKAELGVKYDYKHCGDPEWNKLSNELAELDKKLKARETFLKAVTAPFELLDKDSGEVSLIRPPLKKSTSGVKVFIK